MRDYKLTKHCLLNGFISNYLETEVEKLRECVLSRDKANENIEHALNWFSKYTKKLNQAKRLQFKLRLMEGK